MHKWQILIVAPVLAAGLMLGGCGDSGASNGGAGGQTTSTTTPEAQPAVSGTIPEAMQAFTDDGNVVELAIEGNDRMQFNRDRFQLRPGEMVRLTLKHVGQLPAQSMGHNVVILKKGDDPFEFGADVNEQGGAMDNDYVPEPLRDRVVAFTEIIGGGEETVVEFRAPQEPGEYPFLCSFPGHAGMMNGIVEVSE